MVSCDEDAAHDAHAGIALSWAGIAGLQGLGKGRRESALRGVICRSPAFGVRGGDEAGGGNIDIGLSNGAHADVRQRPTAK